MNEPDPAGVSPGTTPTSSSDSPTPAQTTLLQYLEILPAEPISQVQAADLIALLEADSEWQPHLQAWHRDKYRLYPDLFPKPQRSFRDARWWQSQITDGSHYGYSFRQPTVNQTLVILESLDIQAPGWDRESKKRRAHRFMNELATLSPELCKPGCSFPHELPAEDDNSEDEPSFDPAVHTPSAPFVPSPYAAMSQAPTAPSQPVWQPPVQPPPQDAAPKAKPARKRGAGLWALLLLLLAAGAGAYGYFGFRAQAPVRDDPPPSSIVTADRQGNAHSQPVIVLPTLKALDSQRRAMEKYPDLGKGGSPLNQTFVAMVHQLEVERSPRLQQPNWPEDVADQCASALVIKPVNQKAAVPSPAPTVRKTAAATPAPTAPRIDPAPVVPVVAAATPGAAAVTVVPVMPMAAAPSATPRPPIGSLFVTMDAVNKASVNNYTYNWVSFYGDYDISFRQSVGIDVKIRNMMRTATAMTLRWAFFSRNSKRGNDRNIFAAAEKRLELAPGQTVSEAIDSPMVRSTVTVYYDYGTHYLSGSKYEGWLVQLIPEGSDQVIKQVGSTSYLEDYGKRSDFGTIIKQAMKK